MHLLEGKNLTKTFGGIVAVSNVSFYVDKGEILGLIGPNGAGKTTLFNLVSGMHAPNSGIVEFNGEKISGLRPYQICPKGIARTFQLTQSFNNLSVIENVMVGALFGKDAIGSLKVAREKALKLMNFAGLADKADLSAESLIQVDARRLELVRALATNPKILLLDEVMAGLNPSDIAEAMKLIQKIRNETGVTIIMVEHIMASVMTISDRVIVLAGGKLICDGTPSHVCNDPGVIEAYLGEKEDL